MPLPDHIATFIDINTAGRTHLLCRSLGIFEPYRIDYYTRALRTAVLALADDPALSVVDIDRIVNEQLDLLLEALKNAPAPEQASRPEAPAEPTAPPTDAGHRHGRRRPRDVQNASAADASMERKLAMAREPLRKLLQEDCVRLGLLEPERAAKLSTQLAGKSREDAEAEVVAELRNNLHQQLKVFLKKAKGGPWQSPAQQEELRLDIGAASTVQGVANLTRRILREREQWETETGTGLFQAVFGRKK